MTEYGKGKGGTTASSEILCKMALMTNQHDRIWKGGGDTEQFGNVQESERYAIHVSGTKTNKKKNGVTSFVSSFQSSPP